LCDFRLKSSNPQLQNLPMLHSLVWLFITPSSKTNTGIHP
jgi:hypothetical protein